MTRGDVLQGSRANKNEVNVFSYSRKNGLVGMMDCGGSNISLINSQLPGVVKLLVSSRSPAHPECSIADRKEELGVEAICVDFDAFDNQKGVKKGEYFQALQGTLKGPRAETSIAAREYACRVFHEGVNQKLKEMKLPLEIPFFGAGFMALLHKEFFDEHLVLNVHPGDLTYKKEGKRYLVGDAWRPSARALRERQTMLRSSMHIMVYEMDAGPLMMRGYALPIDYEGLATIVDINDRRLRRKVAEAAQETLKYIGDHVIAGATFMDLFEGNWGTHVRDGCLCYRFQGEWYRTPDGILIDDHVRNNPGTPFERSRNFIDDKIDAFYAELELI